MGDKQGIVCLTEAEARACVGGGPMQASTLGFWTPPPDDQVPCPPVPPRKIIVY